MQESTLNTDERLYKIDETFLRMDKLILFFISVLRGLEEITLDSTQWKEWLTRNLSANVVFAKVTIEGEF
jgi:hypothetical protein